MSASRDIIDEPARNRNKEQTVNGVMWWDKKKYETNRQYGIENDCANRWNEYELSKTLFV